MSRPAVNRIFTLLTVLVGLWLGLRYLLPLGLPFLLGGLLAVAAEPAVQFGTRKLHLKRGLCAPVCVSVTLVLLLGLMILLSSLLIRQLGNLAGALPNVEETARRGLTTVQDFLLRIAYRSPDGVRPLLTKSVLGLFSGGNQLVEQVTRRIPAVASSFLSHVPDGALMLFTAVLSAFMVSVRLPKLRRWAESRSLSPKLKKLVPTLQRIRLAAVGWLKAQLRLCGMSFLILTAGLFALQVRSAPVWALLIALVDALPLLGTGTVLLPWALICLVQGQQLRGLGLLGIYAVTALTRSALEPRLLGRQLGLDPLVTLAALYAGYRLWGIIGMLLAPLLSVVVKELTSSGRE